MKPSEKRKEVGPTTPPVLAHTVPTHLYKYPPMGHRESSTYKQHNIHDPNSRTMFRYLQIWYHSVDNQLLSIFYIMKLHHDLKLNHTYIFSHFLIRDGNRKLLIISLLSDV